MCGIPEELKNIAGAAADSDAAPSIDFEKIPVDIVEYIVCGKKRLDMTKARGSAGSAGSGGPKGPKDAWKNLVLEEYVKGRNFGRDVFRDLIYLDWSFRPEVYLYAQDLVYRNMRVLDEYGYPFYPWNLIFLARQDPEVLGVEDKKRLMTTYLRYRNRKSSPEALASEVNILDFVGEDPDIVSFLLDLGAQYTLVSPFFRVYRSESYRIIVRKIPEDLFGDLVRHSTVTFHDKDCFPYYIRDVVYARKVLNRGLDIEDLVSYVSSPRDIECICASFGDLVS